MRTTWAHADGVMGTTGIIGHSYGGLLAGRLAVDGHASTYVSLSGEWIEWVGTEPSILGDFTVPSSFTWGSGSGSDDIDAQLEGGAAGLFDEVPPPKHRLVIDGANHFDYIPATSCSSGSGLCDQTDSLATEFTAMFLGRYLPPQWSGLLPSLIDPDLAWPPITLSFEHEFYMGAHQMILRGLTPLSPGCSLAQTWETDDAGSGSIALP